MNKYLVYLSERFPLKSYVPIIAIFSFSAICYSLSANGEIQFIPWLDYLKAFFLTFTIFLLLRISDEFKDHEDDMKYRKYLPVPRGLITLQELKWLGILLIIMQIFLIVFNQSFLGIYLVSMVYLGFMFKEFFIEDWLKSHQMAYVISHMMIIPLVDLVASAAHWSFVGINPPMALAWFFAVSFFNGIVLEIGRKIKLPEHEEEGVVSYSKLWGMHKAVYIWIFILLITLILSFVASYAISSPFYVYVLLGVFASFGFYVAFNFLANPTQKKAKMIENAAGLWTMGMYLNLGALPFIIKNLL